MSDDPLAEAGYLDVPPSAGGAAGRPWWDANADEYLDEHGAFLGPADFCWCPEGLREKDARLLGDLSGRRVLEVGAGAAQCARWLVGEGVDVVATDVSGGMLDAGARYDADTGRATPLVQADARVLPFADDVLRRRLHGVRCAPVRARTPTACTRRWRGSCGPAAGGCSP